MEKLGHFVASGHSKVLFFWVTIFVLRDLHLAWSAGNVYRPSDAPLFAAIATWQKFSSWLSLPLQKHLNLQPKNSRLNTCRFIT